MSNLGGEIFEPSHLESLDMESFDKTLLYFMNE